MTVEDQLRAIIVRYGNHDADCAAYEGENCSCGYLDALRAVGDSSMECSVFDCDEVPTVGVRWTGEDKDLFRFCAEHDPRKAGTT